MTGTRFGSQKAVATIKAKYGEDFYKNIGKIGGKNGCGNKGFANNPALARIAGAKGGRVSRRSKKTNE